MAARRTQPKSPPKPRAKKISFRVGVLLVAIGFGSGAVAVYALKQGQSVSALVTRRMMERGAASTARPVPITPPSSSEARRTRIAIVLDDWGYNLDAFEMLKEVRVPLTLAVLPDLPYSARIAESAHREGHQIILHMPMEPKGVMPPEKSTIRTGMTDTEIRDRLAKALGSMPQAVGVSNHQGSKATADTRVMKTVLAALGEKHLFFLDSLTTGDSVAAGEARLLGMKVLKRDVFLDNERTDAAVQARLDELVRVAKTQGYAIGIGHDEPVTLEAIRRNLDRFAAEGIEVVPLSQLVQTVASTAEAGS